MSSKTERLTVKLLRSDKLALERLAREEGEAMAVIVRRLIRRATQRFDELAHQAPGGELYDEPIVASEEDIVSKLKTFRDAEAETRAAVTALLLKVVAPHSDEVRLIICQELERCGLLAEDSDVQQKLEPQIIASDDGGKHDNS